MRPYNSNYTEESNINYETEEGNNSFLGGIFPNYPTGQPGYFGNQLQGTIPNQPSNINQYQQWEAPTGQPGYFGNQLQGTIPNQPSNINQFQQWEAPTGQPSYFGNQFQQWDAPTGQPGYFGNQLQGTIPNQPSNINQFQQMEAPRPFYNFFEERSNWEDSNNNMGAGSSRQEHFNYRDNNSMGAVNVMDANEEDAEEAVVLSTEIENEEDAEEAEDLGPIIYSDPATGEDYTEPSDFSDINAEIPELRRSDTTLLVMGRSERHHPVEALNDIEMFDQLGGDDVRLEPEDELAENMVFHSKEALKFAIHDWAVRKNYALSTPQTSNTRLVMTCQGSGCKWRLYARPESISTAWIIITNKNPHTCRRRPGDRKHDQLTASLIAACVRQHLKNDLSLTVKQIGMIITTRYPFVLATYNKLWRGRERAVEQLFGSWEGSYTLLPQILEAIARSTPGTKYAIIKHETTDNNVKLFKSAAWAYGPCIEAFKYLRPVITIDGGFLSGRYQGRLLMACGYDAENKLLPLAFGLVDEENLDNWGWFLRWIRKEVIQSNMKICVISDRHKGIKAVFDRSYLGWSEQLGEAVHRYCMQHVAENLFKVARKPGTKEDSLKDEFKKKIANKKKLRRFIERMRILKKSNRKAYDFLKTVGKKLENDRRETPDFAKWAQTYDGGHRWGIMTSNGSEALNSLFKVERTLPVVAIVEGSWYKCAKWFDTRKMLALGLERAGKQWPIKIEDILAKRDEKAARMTTISLGTDRGEYEVQVYGERIEGGAYGPFKYTVTISHEEPTRDDPQLPEPHCKCDCQKPQLTGLPCSHVIAVCQHRNFDVYSFIDTRYNTQNLINTWSGQFHSYGDQQAWPSYLGGTLLPDKNRVNRGRRQKVRRKMVMDEMEGRKRDHGKSRTNPREKRQEQSTQTREPIPMDVLQSGRHTSRPPTPTRNISVFSSSMRAPTTGAVEHARYSTSYDPRDNNRTLRHDIQPSRNSIDVPRIHVAARQDVGTSTSTGRNKESSFGGRILNFFSRRKKK